MAKKKRRPKRVDLITFLAQWELNACAPAIDWLRARRRSDPNATFEKRWREALEEDANWVNWLLVKAGVPITHCCRQCASPAKPYYKDVDPYVAQRALVGQFRVVYDRLPDLGPRAQTRRR